MPKEQKLEILSLFTFVKHVWSLLRGARQSSDPNPQWLPHYFLKSTPTDKKKFPQLKMKSTPNTQTPHRSEESMWWEQEGEGGGDLK